MRLTEGRLVGQEYAPYPTDASLSPSDLMVFDRGVQAPVSQRSVRSSQDRAFASLLQKNLDQAVDELEEALRETPGEPALLSDLSALYGERARSKRRPQDYVTSLEMAERAWSLAPKLPEAAFNRAIALERVFDFGEAKRAWDFYLKLDGYSAWSKEAAERSVAADNLKKLRGKLVSIPPSYDDRGPSAPKVIHVFFDLKQEDVLLRISTAEHLEFLGRPAEAWMHRYPALAWASMRPGRLLYEVLDGAIRSSLKQHRPAAALDFQRWQVALAEEQGEPENIVSALLRCSRIEATLGRPDEARRDYGKAIESMERVPEAARSKLSADIDIAQRELGEREERAAAIAAAMPDVAQLVARADFNFQRGDGVAAEKDLQLAIDEFERQRENVLPGDDRIFFLDQGQNLYERMTALELNLAQSGKALEVVERFRARTLLDQLQKVSIQEGDDAVGREGVPLAWPEICVRLPSRTLVVVYAVVEGRLVTWLVKSSGVEVPSQQPGWVKLADLAARLRNLRGADRKEMLQLLATLHDALVEPWQDRLSGVDRVVFVPTQSLYDIPFAALLDSETHRFLIQDHVVETAPSASQFVTAVARDQQMSQPLSSALLIGDAKPARLYNKNLPPLPGAARELTALGEVYAGLRTRTLVRADATPEKVLASLEDFDVAHFGVHAWSSRDSSEKNRLVLSSDSNSSEEISVKDILDRDLSRMRLVVLAACGTQAGPVSPSEGSLSLAHSFLAAGVPAVIGSLWPVDDAHTARISVRLHQELRRGADAASALRSAQLAELARDPGRSDWTWASFQLFGGVAAREPQTR